MAAETTTEAGQVASLPTTGANFEASNGRGYLLDNVVIHAGNLTDAVTKIEQFDRDSLGKFGNRRTVARVFVDAGSLEDFVKECSERYLQPEAIVDLGEYAGIEGMYMVNLGRNIHETYRGDTEANNRENLSSLGVREAPRKRIDNVFGEDSPYELVTSAAHLDREQDVADLTSLWSMFGWTTEGVAALIHHEQQLLEQQERSHKEYAFVRNGSGRIVAAMLAESSTIELRCPDGTVMPLRMWESSEWAVAESHPDTGKSLRGSGIGTALAAQINSQVVTRDHQERIEHSFLFAECNLSSGASRVGARSGLSNPVFLYNEEYLPSVFAANVEVLDGMLINQVDYFRGLSPEERKHFSDSFGGNFYRYWRNFALMALPIRNRRRYYLTDIDE